MSQAFWKVEKSMQIRLQTALQLFHSLGDPMSYQNSESGAPTRVSQNIHQKDWTHTSVTALKNRWNSHVHPGHKIHFPPTRIIESMMTPCLSQDTWIKSHSSPSDVDEDFVVRLETSIRELTLSLTHSSRVPSNVQLDGMTQRDMITSRSPLPATWSKIRIDEDWRRIRKVFLPYNFSQTPNVSDLVFLKYVSIFWEYFTFVSCYPSPAQKYSLQDRRQKQRLVFVSDYFNLLYFEGQRDM